MKNAKSVISSTFLCIIFFALAACHAPKHTTTAQKTPKPKPKTGVEFYKSPTFFAVLDKAAAENKLVFVDFYTDWCTPCKLMDQEVFTDPEVARFMNKHFINYKVDADQTLGTSVGGLYAVKTYPTLVFLNANGVELVRKEGAAFHTQLVNMGMEALSKAGYASK